MMTAVIEVTGLTKRYGGRRVQAVVDDIAFHVDAGEIFGILGPNGAGKTTAVECMEGLRRRDGGQVRILGLDPLTDRHRLHQRIGVQLQESQLQEKLKVREALELYASFYPNPADWRELLERWGLAGKADTRFARLSGGQKQRLFIALALIGNPEVVFLDELTSGLDPGARHATWDLISQVRAQGVTVVLVSHFMDEVEELCDRVAILERGRIAALDTPAGLVDRAGGEYRVRFRPMAQPGYARARRAVADRAARRHLGRPPRESGRRHRHRRFRQRRHCRTSPQAGPGGRPADRRTQPGQRLRGADRPEHGKLREKQT
jgi:ABC-2 type transport system ATP-binding protein